MKRSEHILINVTVTISKMSLFNKKSENFNIDDAFSESAEDKIRLYSNSSETAPLTDTIYEEQEPPDFEGSSLALSPAHSPDTPFTDFRPSTDPPIIKTKSILKNPTLQALRDKEDNKDVSNEVILIHSLISLLSVDVPRLGLPHPEPARILRGLRADEVLVETSQNQGELEDSNSGPGARSDRSR